MSGDSPLTRRPPHEAPAEDVNVQVIDGLPAVIPAIDHTAPAAVKNIEFLRDFLYDPEEVAHQGQLVFRHFGERLDVHFGNDEYVFRRLRMDVAEGQRLIKKSKYYPLSDR